MQEQQERPRSIPPQEARYAKSGRVTAKFGEIATGAHVGALSDIDAARFHPATHVLTCVKPSINLEKGMIFDADGRAWEVVHATDPVLARLILARGERDAQRATHPDKGKFVALYCKEVRRAARR